MACPLATALRVEASMTGSDAIPPRPAEHGELPMTTPDTQRAATSPDTAPAVDDFWTAVNAAAIG
jgi:hypothetical protein